MTIEQATAGARHAVESQRADHLIERLAERIGARTGVEAVFGEPIRTGELVVVPVARLRWGVGGGGGASALEGASGSGGGGGVAADPIGYLEITATGAVFRPISRPWTSPAFLLSAAISSALVLRALARLTR